MKKTNETQKKQSTISRKSFSPELKLDASRRNMSGPSRETLGEKLRGKSRTVMSPSAGTSTSRKLSPLRKVGSKKVDSGVFPAKGSVTAMEHEFHSNDISGIQKFSDMHKLAHNRESLTWSEGSTDGKLHRTSRTSVSPAVGTSASRFTPLYKVASEKVDSGKFLGQSSIPAIKRKFHSVNVSGTPKFSDMHKLAHDRESLTRSEGSTDRERRSSSIYTCDLHELSSLHKLTRGRPKSLSKSGTFQITEEAIEGRPLKSIQESKLSTQEDRTLLLRYEDGKRRPSNFREDVIQLIKKVFPEYNQKKRTHNVLLLLTVISSLVLFITIVILFYIVYQKQLGSGTCEDAICSKITCSKGPEDTKGGLCIGPKCCNAKLC